MSLDESVNKASETLDQILEAGSDETAADARQFLTFEVENGEYGVNIMRVREIRGWTEVTRIPNSPEYMRGVINLRGLVIPIFDLRRRFDRGDTVATEKHVVIVMAIGDRTIGLLVDAVSDILHVPADDIKAAPDTGDSDISDMYVSGLISIGEKMVVLLDIDYLFDTSVLEQVEEEV
jgi:purine-binding chemotaxis protein CheW